MVVFDLYGLKIKSRKGVTWDLANPRSRPQFRKPTMKTNYGGTTETWVPGELLPKYMSRHVSINRKRMDADSAIYPNAPDVRILWRGSGDAVHSLLATDHPELMEEILFQDRVNGRHWKSRRIPGGIQYWLKEQFDGDVPPPLHPSDQVYFQDLVNKIRKEVAH
jgi:hypothetical protein